ncbi:glycoside hydrolase family 71 protein [Dothidotthia symphoricarpi CBS 119687]|uniref:Glycoside hydrolase family 71 protein n=1 Tax=Dothidotthia symphoricarpi CBS 119687 TaxID=1392245 RepID=A0A6A6A803_9PLEO|nr:glycoside hydrolase family 71 protein [Dothidotthia symphoricarpi CBS 119687]KAF2127686.1 glycoside hydrolase family 71 protein [Dothidotthia symphoricarpi CBS 119687]
MRSVILLVAGLLARSISAVPSQPVVQRQDGGGRMVFAHFMMGIVQSRGSSDDYDEEFGIAKAAGIDAFALNMGPDVSNTQLGHAYDSAAKVGIKVFISFDFNSGLFSTGDPAAVGDRIKAFKGHSAQLIVDNKPFVSSFIGTGLNVASVESAAGTEITFFPNWYPQDDQTGADGLFNWMGWYNDGSNNPGTVAPSVGDQAYLSAVGSKDRYMAPVAPWFSAHYGGWVPYTKNWIFQGNDLWFERWKEILTTGPRFIEIVAWNDYGESSYVGPLRARHDDDGHSGWVNDMPHGGWLEMAKPFIAAFKSGATSPTITEEKLVYWYRPMPKGIEGCTDPLGKPNGWDLMTDEVFVVALLTQAGTVTVTSGPNTKSFEAPAGASLYKVPMGVGTQKFTLTRGSTEVMSDTSLRDILNTCPCGLYNFNAYVGTVPASPADVLVDNGNIKSGGGTCEPKSSLPIRAPGSSRL